MNYLWFIATREVSHWVSGLTLPLGCPLVFIETLAQRKATSHFQTLRNQLSEQLMTDLRHSRGGRCRRQESCLWWWLCWAPGPVGWGLWRSFPCGKRRIPWRAGSGTPPTGPAGRPLGRHTEGQSEGGGTSGVCNHGRARRTETNEPLRGSPWRGHIQRAPPSSAGTRPHEASSARTPREEMSAFKGFHLRLSELSTDRMLHVEFSGKTPVTPVAPRWFVAATRNK